MGLSVNLGTETATGEGDYTDKLNAEENITITVKMTSITAFIVDILGNNNNDGDFLMASHTATAAEITRGVASFTISAIAADKFKYDITTLTGTSVSLSAKATK